MKTKSFKKVLACAFAVAMTAVATMTFASAAATPAPTQRPPVPVEEKETEEVDPAGPEMGIKKVLQAADGTELEKDMVFTFKFTAIGDETEPGAETTAGETPAIADVEITIDAGTPATSVTANDGTTKLSTWAVDSKDIFKNATPAIVWPAPGIYRYEVVEDLAGTTVTDSPSDGDKLLYSSAKYDMKLYVGYEKDPAGPNGKHKDQNGDGIIDKNDLVILDATTVVVATETTTITPGFVPEKQPGDKVDPDPVDDTKDTVVDYDETTTELDGSQFIFLNTYINDDSDGPDYDPDEASSYALAVQKTVDGEFLNDKQIYNFSINVGTVKLEEMLPVAERTTSYKAMILKCSDWENPSTATYTIKKEADFTADEMIGDTDGDPVTPDVTMEDILPGYDDATGTFDIDVNKDFAFQLKAGEKLVVINAPAGVEYTVKEDALTGYTATSTVTVAGVDASATYGVTPGTADAGLTGKKSIAKDPAPGTAATVSDNQTTVLNTQNPITPTGILVDNLPYVVMILLAVGAFAAYIVSKRSKASR